MKRSGAWLAVSVALVVSASSGAPRPSPTKALPGTGAAPPRQGVASALPAVRVAEGARPVNAYAATRSGQVGAALDGVPARVYVPNSEGGSVDVIDPATYQVVDRFITGGIPHHVAPSWDLQTLYVDVEATNRLVVIDPKTARPVGAVAVEDPYNLYFTPDGTLAVVVAEVFNRLDFRDPRTFAPIKSVAIPWPGVDHLDFSIDGHFLLASTEYGGAVVKVDTVAGEVVGWLKVGGLPVDVRLAPDGSVFYVANQGRGGVSVIDPEPMKEVAFIPTGAGAHGLQVSRDTKSLYVSNRLAGTISVIDFATRRVTATWKIGGSPDMLQLSPDGRQLWASGRFDQAVYVVDTWTGSLLRSIPVGPSPHGLTYFPNAGSISLGHNGVYR